jgi:hypothetical protein
MNDLEQVNEAIDFVLEGKTVTKSTKNVKKYLTLLEREIKQNERSESYSQGYDYDANKRDLWSEKAGKTNQDLYDMEDDLSEDEKEFLRNYAEISFHSDDY